VEVRDASLLRRASLHATEPTELAHHTVWPEGLSGVQFQQGSTGHIYKCRIYHCGGGGVVVHGKGSRLFVRHCDVYRNHQTGLEARRGGQPIASENKVYDNGTAGFLIGPDAGRCLIRSNKIFENQKAGVAVQLSKEEISVDSGSIWIEHL